MNIYSADRNTYRFGAVEDHAGSTIEEAELSYRFCVLGSPMAGRFDCREARMAFCGIDTPKQLPTRVLDLGEQKHQKENLLVCE